MALTLCVFYDSDFFWTQKIRAAHTQAHTHAPKWAWLSWCVWEKAFSRYQINQQAGRCKWLAYMGPAAPSQNSHSTMDRWPAGPHQHSHPLPHSMPLLLCLCHPSYQHPILSQSLSFYLNHVIFCSICDWSLRYVFFCALHLSFCPSF